MPPVWWIDYLGMMEGTNNFQPLYYAIYTHFTLFWRPTFYRPSKIISFTLPQFPPGNTPIGCLWRNGPFPLFLMTSLLTAVMVIEPWSLLRASWSWLQTHKYLVLWAGEYCCVSWLGPLASQRRVTAWWAAGPPPPPFSFAPGLLPRWCGEPWNKDPFQLLVFTGVAQLVTALFWRWSNHDQHIQVMENM